MCLPVESLKLRKVQNFLEFLTWYTTTRKYTRNKIGDVMNYEEYKTLIQKLLAGDFEQATQKERDNVVSTIIHASAITSTLVSIIPVPFIETPIQLTMVQAIGKVYGQELDEKIVLEIV